jgi:CRISPR/Cas system CSM-associated protein Csm3 (group 7 of RAMP superfamily)
MKIKLEFNIKVESALCVGSTADVQAIGVHKTTTLNSRGQLIVPASTIKGKLRAECERILRGLEVKICVPPNPETTCPNFWKALSKTQQKYCPICEIFGSPWRKGSLHFFDATIQNDPQENLLIQERHRSVDRQVRPGVSISRRRATAEPEKLFFIEASLPHARFLFRGEIDGEVPEPKYSALLIVGLKSIVAFGGGRSRGMGWIRIQNIALNGQVIEAKERTKLMEELKKWQS